MSLHHEEHARRHRLAENPASAQLQDSWSSAHDNSTYYSAESTLLRNETDYDVDPSQYDSLCSQAATVTSLVFSSFSQPSLAAGPSFSWEHATSGQHSTSTPAAARLHSRSRQQRNHPYHRLAEEEKVVNTVPLRNHSRPVVGHGDLRSLSCVSDQGAQSVCEHKTEECDDSEWTLGPGNPSISRPATVAYSALLFRVGP
jgi:hypothetical protein